MNKRFLSLFRFFFLFVDLLIINVVYLSLSLSMARINSFGDEYILLIIVYNMAWLAISYLNGLYLSESHFSLENLSRRSLKTYFLYSGFILFFIFVYHFDYSRVFIGLNLLITGIAFTFFRFLLLSVFLYFRKVKKFGKKVIILGYNDLSKKLVNYFLTHNSELSIEGYFENAGAVNELSGFPILGNCNECMAYAIDKGISEIYSTLSPENNSYVYDLAYTAEKNMIRFRFVPDFHLFVNRNIYIDYADDIPILSLRVEPLEDIANRIKKRLFDLFFSSIMIILILSWILPLVSLIIMITSRGPGLFIQVRSGRNNKVFRCLKFRTLKINREADIRQVTINDSRMTRFGRILRKTNLDELPQFLNVFLGEMSVVGPRPHMIKHTEVYSRMFNEYMVRHFVKPGITGWAQINGFRGEIRREEQLRKRIEHDIWYMENWSLWLDAKIIILTINKMLKGDKTAF